MLKGIHTGDSAFLVQMNRAETRISKSNTQITSGIRVNEAQDDPYAIQSILAYQNQLDQITQLKTNLNLAKNDATYADGALSSVSSILDKLVSIASQGASDLTTSVSRANLATATDQLGQQLVGIANTQIGSRYIFGGDDSSTKPYNVNWAATPGATRVNTADATMQLRDASGTTQQAGMNAADIFDSPGSSIFKAVYDLSTSLRANNTTDISTALAGLKKSIEHLSGVTVFYGNVQTWIQSASNQADSQTSSLSETIAGLRETDLPTAITQMTSNQVSLQAALSAHASLSSKTLFDYLG